MASVCFAEYRTALPGYRYQFPRDHFSHPEFQTEWWYYTGNVRDAAGRKFGFELTFFRQGADRDIKKNPNVWDVEDAWLAHFAFSDIDGNRFLHTRRLNRSGARLAGADAAQHRIWNGNWCAQLSADASKHQLRAVADQFRVDLELNAAKPPVIHGVNGVSQKAEGAGHASHYVSFTRLVTRGSVEVEGKQFHVEGLTWMDHEFFTNQLGEGQTGWDWFSLQLDDGSELMLGRLRRKDGAADPFSSGTYVDRTGRARHLTAREFELKPGRTWASKETKGVYPVEWMVRIPSLKIDAMIRTRLPQQELTGGGTDYWEGAIEVNGTREGRALSGVGYLEMTGYAGAVRMGS